MRPAITAAILVMYVLMPVRIFSQEEELLPKGVFPHSASVLKSYSDYCDMTTLRIRPDILLGDQFSLEPQLYCKGSDLTRLEGAGLYVRCRSKAGTLKEEPEIVFTVAGRELSLGKIALRNSRQVPGEKPEVVESGYVKLTIDVLGAIIESQELTVRIGSFEAKLAPEAVNVFKDLISRTVRELPSTRPR